MPEEKVISPKTFRYLDKNIKISPRKLRLLVNTIKKLSPEDALTQLKFINTLSARILLKAIKTATNIAKNNLGIGINQLAFASMIVGDGLRIKRMDKSHGSRFNRGLIQKRHSRLTIIIRNSNQNPSLPTPHEGEKPGGRGV
jgi:large subunit ribosomal protein L22